MASILTNHESGGSFDNIGGANYEAQGFKVANDSVVSSVSIKMSKGSTNAGANIVISIRSATADGTTIVSRSFPASVLQAYNGSSTSWTEFEFLTPVKLTGATQYYLRYEPATTNGSGDEYRRSLHNPGSYADGQLYVGNSPSGSPSLESGYDLNFRVSGADMTVGGTIKFYVGDGDGETYGEDSTASKWLNARSTGDGGNYADTDWNTLTYYSPGQWSNGSSQQIMRYHIPIDTSALGTGASITVATLKAYIGDNYAASIPGGAPDYFILTPGAQVSTSSVAGTDHALTIPSGIAWSSGVSRTSITTGAYNSFALNATGIAGVNKTGWTKICMVTGGDYENTGYTASWVTRLLITHANATSNKPYLEVTFVPAADSSDALAFAHPM